ncbi:MAG TPA: hypothetical protein VFZ56_14010 [Gemmatimonadaceae bacterium]
MRYNAAGKAAVALALVFVAGCEEIVDLEPEEVAVRAAQALPSGGTATTDFTVDVAVDNFSTRTLYVATSCDWVIEKLDVSTWVPAYTAPCTTETFLEIAPNTTSSLTLTALVAERLDEALAPPGTYRVRLAIEATYSRIRRQDVPEASSTSNEFAVTADAPLI